MFSSQLEWRRITAITQLQFRLQRAKRFSLWGEIVTSILGFITALYLSEFIQETTASAPASSGNESSYLVYGGLGYLVCFFSMKGMQESLAWIERQRNRGTLETFMYSGAHPALLLSYIMTYPMTLNSLKLLAYLLGASIYLKIALAPSDILLVGLCFVCLNLSFVILGIGLSALSMALGKTPPFVGLLSSLILLLSGALFPVETLPSWMRLVHDFIPTSHGIQAIRNILVDNVSIGSLSIPILTMAALGLVLTPFTFLSLRLMRNWSGIHGTLGWY